MIVTVEISFYSLSGEIDNPVNIFIQKISHRGIHVETGRMSTLMSGEYERIMEILSGSMAELLEKYPSVFHLKISNSCPL